MSGTRRLVDACYTFVHPVTLLFSSSEAVGIAWDLAKGPIPEEPLTDPIVASPTGYGASKYIAENVRFLCLLPFLSQSNMSVISYSPRHRAMICVPYRCVSGRFVVRSLRARGALANG